MRNIFRLISLVYAFAIIAIAMPPVRAHELPTIRVNAGGEAYTDSQGQQWEADNYYDVGQAEATTSDAIAGTDDDTLYQSEHWTWEKHQGPLNYTFDVPDGQYQVRLHFAEIYGPTSQEGARVFDASVQDDTVLNNFDIYAEAGANAALIKDFTAEASGDQLTVKLHDPTANNPKISAIEIIGQEHNHPLPTFRMNAGGDAYTDNQNREWEADNYYTNGFTNSTAKPIAGTDNDALYQSERWNWTDLDTTMSYTFDVPDGNYHLKLHYAEIYEPTSEEGGRVFDVAVEDQTALKDFDIYSEADANTALVKHVAAEVDDGQLQIDFINGPANNPKISAIEVIGQSQHLAHAVAGPDQTVVDIDEDGSQDVSLNGSFSHTHATGHELIDYRWSEQGETLSHQETDTVSLPLGTHTIKLTVADSADSVASDEMTVQVLTPSEADLIPQVNSVSPSAGPESGGNQVTLEGYGYFYPPEDTTVTFGSQQLTGQDLTIDNADKITLIAPTGTGNADITVTTPGGTSQPATYSYDDTSPPPVQFTQNTLLSDIQYPTSIAYGPDGKLYVSTAAGEIWIIALDESNNVIDTQTTDIIQQTEPDQRTILGLAFNPYDDPANPKLYVSHSQIFHEGQAPYNGKISALSGAGLTAKEDVITGLPVSSHDHAVNGMEFGPDGEIYVQVGGNTNAGVPDEAIGGLQETPLSAATLVAPIQNPDFDGDITWDGQGNQTGGDVNVFASGFRNPYDLVWHTNGNLYGTDNGPNLNFGPASTSCTTEGPDPEAPDELNLLVQDGYYGHANRVRGASDPRQCTYHPASDPSGNGYTAPLTTFPSSTNGIEEYYVNTFGGQMLEHLLAGRFAGALFDVTLSADGQSVVSNETLEDTGDLDIAIGPDGTIFVIRHWGHEIITYTPDEPAPTDLRILSATHRRGPLTGNRPVTITGNNFGMNPTVEIGGNPCPVTSATQTKIVCTAPHGAAPGPTTVSVTNNTEIATLENGYIYLSY